LAGGLTSIFPSGVLTITGSGFGGGGKTTYFGSPGGFTTIGTGLGGVTSITILVLWSGVLTTTGFGGGTIGGGGGTTTIFFVGVFTTIGFGVGGFGTTTLIVPVGAGFFAHSLHVAHPGFSFST